MSRITSTRALTKKEIEKAFDKLVTEEMSTEEIIRKGLSILGK